jgi:hypothetical protein
MTDSTDKGSLKFEVENVKPKLKTQNEVNPCSHFCIFLV